jgi:dTDP-glucose 4,6-dehydratase
MDYSLAQRELGFTPSVSFADGMAKTIEWYENNGPWLQTVQNGSYRTFMNDWYKERKA